MIEFVETLGIVSSTGVVVIAFIWLLVVSIKVMISGIIYYRRKRLNDRLVKEGLKSLNEYKYRCNDLVAYLENRMKEKK